MVFGCITAKGPGRLHRVVGSMDAEQYCQILEKAYLGTLHDYSLSRSTTFFQHDNDPKHKSKKAQQWFKANNIKILPWPASSPDMNIMEHAWAFLETSLRRRRPLPRNLDQLWAALQEEWARIDIKKIKKLYDSMPSRVMALKKARGGYTKY